MPFVLSPISSPSHPAHLVSAELATVFIGKVSGSRAKPCIEPSFMTGPLSCLISARYFSNYPFGEALNKSWMWMVGGESRGRFNYSAKRQGLKNASKMNGLFNLW